MSSLEVKPPEAIDAKFDLVVREDEKLPARVTAEAMLADLDEWERFKAGAIPDYAWLEIPGVKGKYLPAEWAYKLAPATRVSWEIISKDEFGDPGVRRRIVEFVTYEQKTVTKKRKNKKTGEWYEVEEQVPDLSKPIVSKALLYTAMVRATDRFGRYVDAEGSFRADETTKSDYNSAQQALTRARRRSTLILIGGVDADILEEEKKTRRSNAGKKADAADKPRVSAQELVRRAAALKLCDATGASFVAWAQTIPSCESLAPGGTLTIEQRDAVLAAIVAKEGGDANNEGKLQPVRSGSQPAPDSLPQNVTEAPAASATALSRDTAEAAKPSQSMFFTPKDQADDPDPFDDDETAPDFDRPRKRLFALLRERDIGVQGTKEQRKAARIAFSDKCGIYVHSYTELTPENVRTLTAKLEVIPPTVRV